MALNVCNAQKIPSMIQKGFNVCSAEEEDFTINLPKLVNAQKIWYGTSKIASSVTILNTSIII